MNRKKVTKDHLVRTILWLSIVVLVLIGVYLLKLIASEPLSQFFNAFSAVFVPFIIAFFLSFIIGPLAAYIERKTHMKKGLSIIVAILMGMIVIFGLAGFVIYNLVVQTSGILTTLLEQVDTAWLNGIIESIRTYIETYLYDTEFASLIDELTANGLSLEMVMDLLAGILGYISNLTSSIIQAVMILVLTPVFLFYLIKEKSYIFNGINSVMPDNLQPHFEQLGIRTDLSVQNYLKGQGIMIGLIAVYFTITLSILSFFIPNFDMELSIMFALILGIFNIVPYVGAWIGLSLPIIYFFTNHLDQLNTPEASNVFIVAIVVVLVLQVIEQTIESSIVSPLVLGNKVQIHPLLVLSSLIFFGGLFGFVGVLLAVPLAATLRSSLEYFKTLEKKEIKPKVKKEEVEKA